MLSSDANYPIEPNIFALSYELNALGIGHSFWSCEGHADALGKLSRLPTLWFYAEHVVAVDLLTRHVQHLEDRRKLRHPWRVTALIVGRLEIDCPAFSLAPLVTIANDAGPPREETTPVGILAELRRDLQLIATSLGPSVREQAERELRQIRSELG